VFILFVLSIGLLAQLATPEAVSGSHPTVFVPFVGCRSDGQTGPLDAPKRRSKSVLIAAKDAQNLAYYQSAQGIGVLAPRGWQCFGLYGSGGDTLYVTPSPIDRTSVFFVDPQ
jgi:hypothetical protein